jgi:hypothetical protein
MGEVRVDEPKWSIREVLFDEDGIPIAHRELTREPVAFMFDWVNEEGYSATSVQIGGRPFEYNFSGITISNVRELWELEG